MSQQESPAIPFGALRDLTLAMIIVGSSVTVGAHLIGSTAGIPVNLALGVRFVTACLILTPVCIIREGRLPRLGFRQWGVVFAQALCGVVLFNLLLLAGLCHTDPGSAGIATSTTPACMALCSWLLLGERPEPRIWLGVVLTVAGLMVLQLPALVGQAGGGESWLGILYVLGAVGCESLFLLLRKTLPESLTPLGASTVVSMAGMVLFLPIALVELPGADLAAVPLLTWGVLIYYGAGVSAAAYLFWFSGVVRVSGGVAGIFTGVLPLSALATAALFLGRPITITHIAGCVLVLAAIALLSGIRGGGQRKLADN